MASGILAGAGTILALAAVGSQAAVVAGAAAAVARPKEDATPAVAATLGVKVELVACRASEGRVVYLIFIFYSPSLALKLRVGRGG